jgi:hypothetical protein
MQEGLKLEIKQNKFIMSLLGPGRTWDATPILLAPLPPKKKYKNKRKIENCKKPKCAYIDYH